MKWFAAVLVLVLVPAPAFAEVTKVTIANRVTVAGGQSFGTTGPYEKLTGTIEFALDPKEPHNARMTDIGRAAQDADIGLLRTRRKPFVANAEAASLLARLERTSGDAGFHARAEGALRAASAQLAGQGPLAAHYVLGARQLSGR